MNKKTEFVFQGFLGLGDSEKAELVEAMRDYLNKDRVGRKVLEEVYKSKRVTLGPLSSEVCPCCGR